MLMDHMLNRIEIRITSLYHVRFQFKNLRYVEMVEENLQFKLLALAMCVL